MAKRIVHAKNLLLVLADGDIVWNEKGGDFDWDKTTALPKNLAGFYKRVPLYAEVKDIRTSANSAFRTQIAKLAALIQGRSLEDIFGEEVQQRRTWNAVLTGIILFCSQQRFLRTKNDKKRRPLQKPNVKRLSQRTTSGKSPKPSGELVNKKQEMLNRLRKPKKRCTGSLFRPHKNPPHRHLSPNGGEENLRLFLK